MKKKILFIVNVDWFFLSHRLAIAIEALNQGYEVHVATVVTDKLKLLLHHGLIVHPLTIGRSATSLTGEIRAFLQILNVLKTVRADLVHLVTIKPVLYGGIAARLIAVPGVVAAISGLGYVFASNGLKALLVRGVVTLLYRIALDQKNMKAIFQNRTDRDTLVNLGVVRADQSVIVRGSGTDLQKYLATAEPEGVPVIVMAARLLRDKGVAEFVAAAEILRAKKVSVRFWLVGDLDPDNPQSLSAAKLDEWRLSGTVEIMGFRSDIPELFSGAHIIVLPSYREGLPKVLVEAAACGRAVITTDVPGCRDATEPGTTGLLVPPRDSIALANAMLLLIENPELRKRMGTAGRELAVQEFSLEQIVAAHMNIYRELGLAQ